MSDPHGALPILIVDDESRDREIIARALRAAGHMDVARAESADKARHLIEMLGPFALVILNIRMPEENGLRLLAELAHLAPQTVVIMETSGHGLLTAIDALKHGAYDYLLKPFDVEVLQLSVGTALKRRQHELDDLASQLHLEEALEERIDMLQMTRSALLQAVYEMAEFGHPRGHGHPERVARYSDLIARQLARNSAYSPFITRDLLRDLPECAELHDIGKLALPVTMLHKREDLSPEETAILETHTTVGRDICLSVKEQLPASQHAFIGTAAEVTYSHHERWDGDGYPEGLKGSAIPLSARIVALADYYDVWRSPMTYRPEVLPRHEAVERIVALAAEKFDPIIVGAFQRSRGAIAQIEDRFAL